MAIEEIIRVEECPKTRFVTAELPGCKCSHKSGCSKKGCNCCTCKTSGVKTSKGRLHNKKIRVVRESDGDCKTCTTPCVLKQDWSGLDGVNSNSDNPVDQDHVDARYAHLVAEAS